MAPSIAGCLRDNVAGRSPKLEDSIESAFGDLTAAEDVVEGKKLAFEEPDGRELDVAADSTIHDGTSRRKLF